MQSIIVSCKVLVISKFLLPLPCSILFCILHKNIFANLLTFYSSGLPLVQNRLFTNLRNNLLLIKITSHMSHPFIRCHKWLPLSLFTLQSLQNNGYFPLSELLGCSCCACWPEQYQGFDFTLLWVITYTAAFVTTIHIDNFPIYDI